MRDEMAEVKLPGRSAGAARNQRFPGTRRDANNRRANLEPCAVDEALADESSTCVASPESLVRRPMGSDLPSDDRSCVVDRPHGGGREIDDASLDNASVLRQLADRLAELQSQQSEIQQLLASVRRS